MKYVIRIFNSQNPCWVRKGKDGDPPRTLDFKNAQKFKNRDDAEDRILQIKKTHPLKKISYGIIPIGNI
mgnify:CR=1 FL=1